MTLDQNKIRQVQRSRPVSGNEPVRLLRFLICGATCSEHSSNTAPLSTSCYPPTSPYSLPSEPLCKHRHVEPNCKQLASNSDGGTGLRQGWAYEKQQQQQQNNNCNKKKTLAGKEKTQLAQRRALEGGVGSAVAFLRAWSITHILAKAVTESTWCTGLGR